MHTRTVDMTRRHAPSARRERHARAKRGGVATLANTAQKSWQRSTSPTAAFGGLLLPPTGLRRPGVRGTYLNPLTFGGRQTEGQEKEKGTEEVERKGKEKESRKKEKDAKAQHRAFPRDPPPKYYPGSNC